MLWIGRKFGTQFHKKINDSETLSSCEIKISNQRNNSSDTRDFSLFSQRDLVSSHGANLEFINNLWENFSIDWYQIDVILMSNKNYCKWRMTVMFIQGWHSKPPRLSTILHCLQVLLPQFWRFHGTWCSAHRAHSSGPLQAISKQQLEVSCGQSQRQLTQSTELSGFKWPADRKQRLHHLPRFH